MKSNNIKCVCCKSCKGFSEFRKVVHLKNIGLIIYRYPSRYKDATTEQGKLTKARNITSDIVIVHNTRNVDITADQYLSELEKYKVCPRCKYIFDHTQKMLEKVPQIRRLDTISICDHCLTKISIPCEKCSDVVKMFISSKILKEKLFKEIILWLSNKQELLGTREELHVRRRSQSYSDNLRHISVRSRSDRKPQIGELIDIKKTSHLDLSRPGKIHFSRIVGERSLETKSESILLDINGRHFDFKTQKVYHSDEQLNILSSSTTLIQKRDLEKGNVLSSQQDSKTLLKDIVNEISHEYRDRVSSPRLEKETSKLKVLQEEVTTQPKHQPQDASQKGFSYYFIREKNKVQKSISEPKSSSELIKDIQDKLDAKIEEDKNEEEKKKKLRKLEEEKRKEERRLRRLEEDKRKQIQKSLSVSEDKKKKGFIEPDIKSLYEEKKSVKRDIEKKTKELQEKIPLIKKEKTTQIYDDTLNASSKKSGKEKMMLSKFSTKNKDKIQDEYKNKIIKEKITVAKSSPKTNKVPETKLANIESKTSDKENIKAQKEKEKQEKLEKMQLAKEQKLKEKEEKQKIKKELEEKLRKEKEVMQRIKDEENLRLKEEGRRKKEDDKVKKELEEKEKSENYLHELQKMKEEEAKRKEHEKKLQQEEEKRKAIEEAKRIAKKEAELKLKMMKELEKESEKVEKLVEEEKSEVPIEEPTIKEINVNEVKFRKPSTDDLILRLVKLKQSEKKRRPKRLSELNIPRMSIIAHRAHKNKKTDCVICNDSDLELDIENIFLSKMETKEITDIIIGQKILKHKPLVQEKIDDKRKCPIFFKSTFQDDNIINFPQQIYFASEPQQIESKKIHTLIKPVEQEIPKGVIRYALSDRTFIEKGWTMLPTEKVVRKMNVYRMRPAHPEFDWFEHNKSKKVMCYDTGEKLAEFDDNGRGRWYYRNGRLALDYYDAEEINAQQRFVIHSSGDPDERGRSRPLAILATFDYLGNGIVFDHAGKIRLKYNQTEGVVLDRSIGPVSHWKWHTLNDPPVLQQVMIDTQMAHKDPQILKLGGSGDDKPRPDNEEMLAIEFDNFIKEKSKKLSQKFKPFQIKMKALKINEHFSLKVLDQATVYLIFRDGKTNLKINIGMILDHKEIVDTDTAEMGEVSNSLERFPARTQSLAVLQRSVAHAQRVERARIERESRLRPTEPCCSVDRLTFATCRPLRVPLHVAASATNTTHSRYCRKPPSCNLYYDTRLS